MACSLIATGCCTKVPGKYDPTFISEVNALKATIAIDIVIATSSIVVGALLVHGVFGTHEYGLGLGASLITFGIVQIITSVYYIFEAKDARFGAVNDDAEDFHSAVHGNLKLTEDGYLCDEETGATWKESRATLENGVRSYKKDEDGYFMGPSTTRWKFRENADHIAKSIEYKPGCEATEDPKTKVTGEERNANWSNK